MALREQTVAIAVIGATGSGKSTFIRLASGSNSPAPTSSSSTELQSSTFSLDGHPVTLIDTPGFDDNGPSVLGVLKLISDYFSRLSSQGTSLAGVLYMHRVADAPSRHNFRTLCKFCGDTGLRDVVVVAQGGDPPGEDALFVRAVEMGARMLRHDGSRASAHAILRQILERGATRPPSQTVPLGQPVDRVPHATTTADVSQVAHHANALCHGTDAATLAEGEETKGVFQKISLEKIDAVRHDPGRWVTTFETEKEGEERGHTHAPSAQRTEGDLARLLGEEQFAEAEQCRAEAQQRVVRKREKTGNMETLALHAGQQYVKRFACVAVIFALVCISRIVFRSSTTLLL